MNSDSDILWPDANSSVPRTDLERQLLAENAWLRAQLAIRDKRIAELEKRVEELAVLLAKALKNS